MLSIFIKPPSGKKTKTISFPSLNEMVNSNFFCTPIWANCSLKFWIRNEPFYDICALKETHFLINRGIKHVGKICDAPPKTLGNLEEIRQTLMGTWEKTGIKSTIWSGKQLGQEPGIGSYLWYEVDLSLNEPIAHFGTRHLVIGDFL